MMRSRPSVVNAAMMLAVAAMLNPEAGDIREPSRERKKDDEPEPIAKGGKRADPLPESVVQERARNTADVAARLREERARRKADAWAKRQPKGKA